MITSAVAMSADLAKRSAGLPEQPHGSERLGRPRSEAIEREFCLLSRFDVYKDVVVLLLWWLTLPIKVRRIIRGQLDAGTTGKYGILFRAATAQHEVFHPIDLVHLCGVDMTVEHDHLHVLGVGSNHFVGIIGCGDGPQARPGEYRVVEGDESFPDAIRLGL